MIPYKKKIDSEEIFKISKMKPVIKPTRPHKHEDYHELIFLSEGSGIHQIDVQEFEVNPPVAYYLKPGQVHCWNFTKVPEGFVVLFREEIFDDYHNFKSNLLKIPIKTDIESHSTLFSSFAQLYHEYKTNPSPAIFQAYLQLILIKLIDLEKNRLIIPAGYLNQYYQFKKLVDQHFREIKTVNGFAELMKISTFRLNAICKKAVRKPAVEIIKERIILEAKNQLSHTTMTISEISYDLNFNDPSNFVKFFKSTSNLTPSEYRKLAI